MNFFDIIKTIYTKGKIDFKIDNSLNYTLTKWLSYDKNNLQALKKVAGYAGRIGAREYFTLLFLGLPKGKTP
ncbi:hypothetical protein LCGC14_1948630, partial [marine sediment metagenome]